MTFNEQFPVLAKYTYINTANSGILSQELVNWRRIHDEQLMQLGSLANLHQHEFIKDIRISVASFFKADSSNTFLVPGFSHGFNIVLKGLAGPQKFLLLDDDYPSVNYPVENLGHDCYHIPIGINLENDILEAIGRFKPTVFAFSIVQYISGIKIDLDFIKQLKSEFPDLLIIADGTQYCGTEPFNFNASGIDILIASSYKWMLGGYGNGFVLLKDKAREALYAHNKPSPIFLADQNKDALALHFEPGHLDTLNFGSLYQSIQYMEQLDQNFIKNRIQQLVVPAKEALTSMGLLSPTVVGRKLHSSIFNLNLPANSLDKLQKENIICSFRGNGLRVSFHFYNSEQDLDNLLDTIAKIR